MKVLIIGGTGNIGLPISKKLSKNFEVFVISQKERPDLEDKLNILVGNGNDKEYLTQIQEKYNFDIVCNLIIFKPEIAKINIDVFKGKVKQFIFISTVATYNHEKNLVFDETKEQGNPYSAYGNNKVECEKLFLQAKNKEAFPLTIVRPSQTYSNARFPLSIKGKSCWSVIERILNDKPVIIHGDGKSTWVSTHAEDFSTGFCGLVNNQKAIDEVFQIMSDEIYTWDMIYHMMGKILNKDVKISHITSDILALSTTYNLEESIKGDKQYSVIYNTDKLKKVVPEFNCGISLEDGFKMFLDYMDENPELKVYDKEFDNWCDKVIERYEGLVNGMKEML